MSEIYKNESTKLNPKTTQIRIDRNANRLVLIQHETAIASAKIKSLFGFK